MYIITDEELNTSGQLDQDPRYTIRDNNGNVLYDNVKIELKTPVSVEGTDINKATLEGIQTDLMNETKLLVLEYEVTSDVASVDIQNLDLVTDGGIYDIVIRGNGTNGGMHIRFNNDSGSNYYRSGSGTAQTQIPVDISGAYNYGCMVMSVIYNPHTPLQTTRPHKFTIFVSNAEVQPSSGPTLTTCAVDYAASSGNITSIQLLGGPSVAKGTKVWIYKRR